MEGPSLNISFHEHHKEVLLVFFLEINYILLIPQSYLQT